MKNEALCGPFQGRTALSAPKRPPRHRMVRTQCTGVFLWIYGTFGAETGWRADRLPSKDVFDGSKLIDNCGSVDVRIPDGVSVREVGNDVAAPDPVIGEVPQATVIPTGESTEEGPVNTGAQTQRVGNRVAATARTLQKGAAGIDAQGDPCKLDLYISPSRDAGALAAYPSGAHYVGQTVTLVASAFIGRDTALGPKRWLMILFFGGMYMLAQYVTFSLATMRAAGSVRTLPLNMLAAGLLLSAVGMAIGAVLHRLEFLDKIRTLADQTPPPSE